MNLLFHHLQKTGGTSVRFWVGRALGPGMLEFGPKSRSGTLPRDVYHGHGEKLRSVQSRGSLIPGVPPAFAVAGDVAQLPSTRPTPTTPVRAVMGHYVSLNAAKALGWGDAYMNVTIIRDPAERMFSQWHHFKRKMGPVASFEQWVSRSPEVKELPRICYCLECQFDGHVHRTEPMCHFYGSRVKDAAAGSKDVLGRAKRFLETCQVYALGHNPGLPELAAELAYEFDLSLTDYRREHVSGWGAKVELQHRRLVAKNHPLDAELYEWARGRA